MLPGFMSDKRRGAFALLLLTLLLYTNSLGGGFVWDDEYNYIDNPMIFKQTVRGAFTSDVCAFMPQKVAQQCYRPLHVLAYSWLARLTHLQPFGLHLASVLFHALAGVLAFLLLAEITEAAVAWFAAALFVAHPLHVEAVAWMASLSEILAAVLMLLSLYLLVRSRPSGWAPFIAFGQHTEQPAAGRPAMSATKRGVLLGLSYVVAFAALLMKETALVLPLMAAGLAGLAAWPFFVLAGGYLAMRFAVLRLAAAPLGDRTVWEQLHIVLSAALQYGKKFLWPWPLAPEYVWHHSAIAWALFALCVAAGAWAAWRFARVRLALLFLLPLLPALASSVMFPPLRIVQDRYAYFAVLGVALLLASCANQALGLAGARPGPRPGSLLRYRAGLAACLLLLVAWSGLSEAAIPRWRDNGALWSHTLKVTPQSKTAALGLGSWYYETGRLREAQAVYRQALQRRPNDRDFLTSLHSVEKVLARQK